MAEPNVFLLIALSGRALALAAARAGRRAVVADLFGDTDMRAHAEASLVVAGSLETGFDEASLLAAAERLAPASAQSPCGLVYASGLESRTELLAKLMRGRRLYGNRPETVARCKDPKEFFGLLAKHRIPHPEIRFTAPPDPRGWLTKRTGGSGGSHVRPADTIPEAVTERYYQRRAEGGACGASFLADGRRALLIGVGEQWTAARADATSFRFGGMLQPATLDAGIVRQLPSILDTLTAELGLVGLNSLDLIVDGDRFAVIEVNPRPGANLDIFDGADPEGLFGHHLAACEGRLPTRWQPTRSATAMAVVYAERACRVPADLVWPDWVADRPAPGARIECEAPVCTVLASARGAAAVRETIDARVAEVLARLAPDTRPHSQAAG